MSGEVVKDGLAGRANLAEVVGISAGTQGKNAVELDKLDWLNPGGAPTYLFKLLLVGLVDRAENGQALVGKMAEKCYDARSALTVKAAGGLIQEEQKSRSGTELNADGHPLLLFDV